MKRLFSVIIIFLIVGTVSGGKNSFNISIKEMNQAINNISEQHPRIFLDSKKLSRIKKTIKNNQLMGKAFENIREEGEQMLAEPIPERKGGELPTYGFRRVQNLAFLYKITGENKYLKGAKRAIFTIANWKDWYPRNYIKTSRLAAALGIGYDWLYHELSKKERKEIREAIIEKGFKSSYNGQWWVYSNHNWNSVCHGSLTIAALAIIDEDDTKMSDKVLKRALNAFPILLNEYYGPDGAYPEGPGYYTMATEYSVIMIAALESALGTDFDFKNYDGFMESAKYFLHSKGPTDYYFNYSDSYSGRKRKGVYIFFPEIFWFASETEDPTLLWHQKPMLKKLVMEEEKPVKPLLFLYKDREISREQPENLNWMGQGEGPVSFHRTGWDQKDTYIAIKGGSPGTNHAHMDVGSFVIDAMGERWAMDPGSQSQRKLEPSGLDIWNMNQTSDRWKVFRFNNFSHNTLVIDSMLQRVPGKGRIVRYSSDYDFSYSVVDMGTVYQGQLGNNPTVRRGVGLYKDGSIIIQDEIKAKAKRVGSVDWGMDVQWQMLTEAEVEIVNDNTAILEKNGKKMWLYLLSPKSAWYNVFSSTSAKLGIKNTENPPHDYDAKNEGTRMVTINKEIDAPGEINRITVYLHPQEEAEELPEVKSLYEW